MKTGAYWLSGDAGEAPFTLSGQRDDGADRVDGCALFDVVYLDPNDQHEPQSPVYAASRKRRSSRQPRSVRPRR